MNKRLLAKELVKVALTLVSTEFDSQEALDKYLKEHPDADKSLHSVKKQEKPAEKKEETKSEEKKTSYKDKINALKQRHEQEMSSLHDEYANSSDYSERPSKATHKIKKAIIDSVGGHFRKDHLGMPQTHGAVHFHLGSGYKNSEVTSRLKKIKKILDKHGVKTPDDPWEIMNMRDGDGNALVGFSA
jgi:hypothetical protein